MDKNIDKLLSYSLDQLDEKEKVQFEIDLENIPELDDELLDMQNILENIALAEMPIAPSAQLKTSLFSTLDDNTPFFGYMDRFMRLFDLERDKVEALFTKVINTPGDLFDPCGIPNTSLHFFDGGPTVSHAECGIIKVQAGGIFPAHQHQGKEWVFVLQGNAIDRVGVQYSPGDMVFSDESVSHSLLVSKDEDLIFAVVLEKPNKWLIGQIIMDYLFSTFRFKAK